MPELLGLSPPAERAYRALLRVPGTALPQLAYAAGVDEETTQLALDELRSCGLLRTAPDGRLVPTRPDLALEPFLLDAERELVERMQGLLDARREVSELVEAYTRVVAEEGSVLEVECIHGLFAINRRLDELHGAVTQEVLSIATRLRGVEAIEEHRLREYPLLARGVRARTIVPAAIYQHPEALAYAREVQTLGDQHRVLATPPLQMLIYDRRLVIVPVELAAPSDGVLIIWSRSLVDCLAALFETAWGSAGRLAGADADTEVPDGLTERHSQLLPLLAAGLTDEMVARHLRCSVRTVRREEAALCRLLGAGTRFQAGVEAARRGWL